MCHERWMRRRPQEAEEARDVWADFERSTPIADPDPPRAEPQPARVEADEEVVGAES